MTSQIKRASIDVCAHLFFTILIAMWIYGKTGNLVYVSIFVLGGIFIDLDHLIDHFLCFKNKLNLYDFVNGYYIKTGKVYVFLHSWEINFILFMLALNIRSYGLFLLFLSLSIHLAIDNIQRRNLLAYFIIYRFINNFDINIVFPEVKERLEGKLRFPN